MNGTLSKRQLLLIAGTRPNFIKLAPLYHRLQQFSHLNALICHTGQHFDYSMSEVFWENLDLPKPDFSLAISGASVNQLIGKTLVALDEVVNANHFDGIVVFGDVNATAAGAICAAQNKVPLFHIEAGLRSFDKRMPEENNRIIADHLSDYLFVSEASGIKNLENEGINNKNIFFTGNIMIECLMRTKAQWENLVLPDTITAFCKFPFVIGTFHRPENVDSKEQLLSLISIISTISQNHRIILPLHPRTKQKLIAFDLMGLLLKDKRVLLTEALPYFEFLNLIQKAEFVITDSGGVQEETSFLNIPCITFRNNTERPVTVEIGTNLLLSLSDTDYYKKITNHLVHCQTRHKSAIPYWDQEVSLRILNVISSVLH